MTSAYVCRQCRARLTQRVASFHYPQWQSQATFISLRTQQPADETNTQEAQDELSNAEQLLRSGDQRLHATYSAWTNDRAPRTGRYSRYTQIVDTAGTSREGAYPSRVKQAAISSTGASAPEEQRISYARSIEEALKRRDVQKAWDLFLENYTSKNCTALTDPSFQDIALLNGGKIFAKLSTAIGKMFYEGDEVPATPTHVLFRYEQLGIARHQIWRSTMANLTDHLLSTLSGSSQEKRDFEVILLELISVWRLFFQCKGRLENALDSISPYWDSIPSVEELAALTDIQETRNFGLRLQHYHPKYVLSPVTQFSAITVFNLLNQSTLDISNSVKEQAQPFVNLLTYLLGGASVTYAFKHTEVSTDFKGLPDDFRRSVLEQIKSAPRQAMMRLGSEAPIQPGSKEATTDRRRSEVDSASKLEQFYQKRIARAVLSQSNATTLNGLWDEVVFAYTPQDTKKPAIPPKIYDAFLAGFMALFQSERSVQVWNHMIAHGIHPTLRTWVALLEGCEQARDLNGLNAVWDRMVNAGVEPDNYAWTTRVHGLISLRQIHAGFAALDEMGTRWLSAEEAIKKTSPSRNSKGDRTLSATTKVVNICTKPSVEVINGAISALVQPRQSLRLEKRIDFVHKVLQWGGNFDIRPDVRTYNTLIQLYLNAGDYSTTFKILRQMEKEGMEGDVATHNMLIRAAFNNQKFDNMSPTQQAERVLHLFEELEKGGLKLNAYVYSSTIDRLLKQYSNFVAVRIVVDHMLSRKLVPSPQIYTSLITHYFREDPPSIVAADSLVTQIFSNPRATTDKILFDRIVEGYADHGEVGKMMSVLARMSKHGKLPGWQALMSVVRALVKAGDHERARLVVKDVQLGEGVAKGGITGGEHGQREFFALIRGLSLGLEQPSAEEVWRNDGAVRDAAGTDVSRKTEIQEMAQIEETRGTFDERTEIGAEGEGRKGWFEESEQTESRKVEQRQEEDHGNIGGVPL